MSEYTGKNAIGTWVTSDGTTALHGNQRQFAYTPSIDLHEATAGSDAAKSYITGCKDGQFTATLLAQEDDTAFHSQFVEGKAGTITNYTPQGSNSGAPTMTFAAICMGVADSTPYNDVVTYTVNFQQNGERTDGTVPS